MCVKLPSILKGTDIQSLKAGKKTKPNNQKKPLEKAEDGVKEGKLERTSAPKETLLEHEPAPLFSYSVA